MKIRWAFLLLALLANLAPPYVKAGPTLEPHEPILINGNQDFIPFNGVTQGSGTASDPYIIEGWNIYTTETGINIGNTSSFFTVRNVLVHAPAGSHAYYGIRFYNVTDARIENATVTDAGTGIVIHGSQRVGVSQSTIRPSRVGVNVSGILVNSSLIDSSFVTISDSKITNSGIWGIRLTGLNISLIGNTLFNNSIGIFLGNTRNLVISNNRIQDNGDGVVSDRTLDSLTILGNEISGNRFGVSLRWELDERYDAPPITRSNVTIADNDIKTNERGIRVRNAVDSIFKNNLVSENGAGLDVDRSHRLNITDNTISSNFGGVALHSSRSISLVGNRISSNNRGVDLGTSSEVTVSANTFLSNGLALQRGNLTRLNSYTITPDNTVNGKPILFYKNCQRGLDIDGTDIGQLFIVNCTGIRVANLRILDTDFAVQLFWVTDVFIMHNTLLNNSAALYISFANNVTITENHLSSDRTGVWPAGGILIDSARDVSILRNRIGPLKGPGAGVDAWNLTDVNVTSNHVSGITGLPSVHISGSNDVTVKGNVIDSNDTEGLHIGFSRNVTISGNYLHSNHDSGINVQFSTNITVSENVVSLNGMMPLPTSLPCGILLRGSRGATASRNDIINNAIQACDDMGIDNSWDSGYPAGGNYWTDYDGQDKCSGPAQDVCPDPDDIGDTPHVIDTDSRDNYPSIFRNVAGNTAVVAFFSVFPSTGSVGTTFTTNASLSWDIEDPPNSIEVRWDWEDDGSWDTDWSTNKEAAHEYSADGKYKIRVEVRDSGGLVDTTTRQVAVGHDLSPPIWPAESLLTVSNVRTTSLTLSWTAAQDDANIAAYRLYQGDTLIATLPANAHSYTVIGLAAGSTYTFRVEAADFSDNWSINGPSLVVTTPQEEPTPAPPKPSNPLLDYWYLIPAGLAGLAAVPILVRARRSSKAAKTAKSVIISDVGHRREAGEVTASL